MSDYNNMTQLLDAIGNDISLTDAEQRTIEWLSDWDTPTIDNLCSILRKIKANN